MKSPLFIALLASASALSGCTTSNAPRPALPSSSATASATAITAAANSLADDFVRLSLEAGSHEAGYIDAYYGDPALRAAAEAKPRSKSELTAAAVTLQAAANQLLAQSQNPQERRRLAALSAQILAAETRLRMMQGEQFRFADEAERLFGVRPELNPLTDYDAPLAALARLLPGTGPLPARMEEFSAAYTIPKDRLQAVFDKSIALCRAKSMAYIPMPAGESFALSFVTDKSWSGYNYYQGGFHSKIEVNTDFPIRLPRAIDLGCHEGYPGHHLLNMKLEERLVRERGWREFSVYPLYSPLSLIAEGTANYGITLAFPDKQQVERDILMPLAGIAPAQNDLYWQIQNAMAALGGARLTIAQQYLDGEIDRETAIALSQKYLLLTPERADQSIRFTEQYRSYVINYGLGEAMVRRYIESNGANEAERWRRMQWLISEAVLPSDLLRAPK